MGTLTRPDQTRPDQTRPDYSILLNYIYDIRPKPDSVMQNRVLVLLL